MSGRGRASRFFKSFDLERADFEFLTGSEGESDAKAGAIDLLEHGGADVGVATTTVAFSDRFTDFDDGPGVCLITIDLPEFGEEFGSGRDGRFQDGRDEGEKGAGGCVEGEGDLARGGAGSLNRVDGRLASNHRH